MRPLSLVNPQYRPLTAPANAGAARSAGEISQTTAIQPALAQSVSSQQSSMFSLMAMMMQMMMQMFQLMKGQPSTQTPPGGIIPGSGGAGTVGSDAGSAGGAGGTNSTAVTAGNAGGVVAGAGTVATAGSAGTVDIAGTVGAGSAGGASVAVQFSQDDYKQYIMGQSFGGTQEAGTDDIIRFTMDQNSKLYKTGMAGGDNEVDAVIAKSYADQFKGYALGLDVTYKPGEDMSQIAANIAKGGQTKMTPEAETIANVAALYRGELSTGGNGSGGAYDNKALQNLLVSWGRQDIAAQAGVGDGDIQSVGGVVRALNEENDATTRQKWLNQIFDFQNNSPNSPSGAVPQEGLANYQKAVSLYGSGAFDQLLDNYNNNVYTKGPVPTPQASDTGKPGASYGSSAYGAGYGGTKPNGGTDTVSGGGTAPGTTPGGGVIPNGNTLATPDVDRTIDFMFPELDRNNPADAAKLSELRSQMGLSERDRGILHLWGRQIISKGFQDGSIYNNVLSGNWQDQDEIALVQELQAKETQEFGGITGKALDREFFALMQRMNPDEQIDPSRWLNAPVRFSDGQPLDIVSDINTLEQRSGLNATEQAALRLWGHDPLTNGGTIDGSVLAYTLGNANALDSQAKAPNGQNVDIDPIAKALLEADIASDGVRNGDSLRFAFDKVLDKVYLGTDGLNTDQIQQNAQQAAQVRGRTPQQIGQDVQQGMTQALSDAAKFVKDHPVVSAAAVGGVAAATAVCPFLGGLGVGAAGIMAGQAMANKGQAPAA